MHSSRMRTSQTLTIFHGRTPPKKFGGTPQKDTPPQKFGGTPPENLEDLPPEI